MKPTPDNYKELFDRLVEGKLTPDEAEALINWLGQESLEPEAAEVINKQLQRSIEEEQVDSSIVATLEEKLPFVLAQGRRRSQVFSMSNKWLRYAAVFLVVLSFATVYIVQQRKPSTETIVQVEPSTLTNDIAPGKGGAILTLADGSTVVIDSLGNGLIAKQHGSKVLLQNGQLTYNTDGSNGTAVAYNTISTPNGRQFQLVLSDGTKVWLNAGSSLRFPTVFNQTQRRVEVTGEGYFEVVKDRAKPFIVSINSETEIEVLGTHFNVNSYSNETSIKTTLLEGSVKVRSAANGKNSEVLIEPGQQAQLKDGKFRVNKNADVGKVMAWKNGVFDFEDATLEEVMRQLERWYDIEVVYEKGIPKLEFVGKVQKDLSLAKVLRGLEMSEVRFRLEGRKLIVMP